jgi:hypothetical protein
MSKYFKGKISSARSFLLLNRRDKKAFIEALVFLLMSHISINVFSFRYVYRILKNIGANDGIGRVQPSDHQLNDIKVVGLSLARAARICPLEVLCLSCSIAAFVMLRRRGVPAVVLAGVKFENSVLRAHAWVQTGDATLDTELEEIAFTVVMSIGEQAQSHGFELARAPARTL